jgi:glucose-1-phosphate adenylyltransferase
VNREEACGLGIMAVDPTGRIEEFMEKPGQSRDISNMRIPDSFKLNDEQKSRGKSYLASMGIYLFNSQIMEKALNNDLADFGKHIIPSCIDKWRVHSYMFTGFWKDVGTIKSFYEANMNLTTINPSFNFYDEVNPIYTNKTHLPASKVNGCMISQSLTSDGCIITNAVLNNSIIGSRTIIENETFLDSVVCMGSDYYETPKQKDANRKKTVPDLGIGRGSRIKGAIIDMNARIGRDCRIGIDEYPRKDGDYSNYVIKDGIVVIKQDAVILDNTNI